ncbi:uncharacterized protein CIMG_11347 [Coccidioides immitis RS]|uniref:Uncharacterized protein n=1 Tax=Coccidioides immitis (strain RS) TaxID=246410 RepID=A0A0D8JUH3_COCIM|nr:uncharacterized protein CIMG_11347 [Coccidioides immitis RS]KJF61000.1 hypothetical protein CIMG_11347 [Coccidioides immitis RS]
MQNMDSQHRMQVVDPRSEDRGLSGTESCDGSPWEVSNWQRSKNQHWVGVSGPRPVHQVSHDEPHVKRQLFPPLTVTRTVCRPRPSRAARAATRNLWRPLSAWVQSTPGFNSPLPGRIVANLI